MVQLMSFFPNYSNHYGTLGELNNLVKYIYNKYQVVRTTVFVEAEFLYDQFSQLRLHVLDVSVWSLFCLCWLRNQMSLLKNKCYSSFYCF